MITKYSVGHLRHNWASVLFGTFTHGAATVSNSVHKHVLCHWAVH